MIITELEFNSLGFFRVLTTGTVDTYVKAQYTLVYDNYTRKVSVYYSAGQSTVLANYFVSIVDSFGELSLYLTKNGVC